VGAAIVPNGNDRVTVDEYPVEFVSAVGKGYEKLGAKILEAIPIEGLCAHDSSLELGCYECLEVIQLARVEVPIESQYYFSRSDRARV
jgi:hypothetical protein